MTMNKASGRIYEEFEPVSDMISEEGCDTLILYLPGFKKEQLKVQLTTSRILRISGERPVGDNKWRRFNKEVRIPQDVDTKEITAKFEDGILHIKQPKLITSASKAQEQEKPKHDLEVPRPQTQEDGPKAVPGFRETDAKAENKDERGEEEIKSKPVSKEKHKQVVYGSRIFKELMKPEKQKKLVVSVLIVLILMLLGFSGINLYRAFFGDDQQSIVEYAHREYLHPT